MMKQKPLKPTRKAWIKRTLALKGKKRATRRLSGNKSNLEPTKKKLWSLRKADSIFSKQIRERDGKCLHPRHVGEHFMLQCSHYHGRARKSTRFDPENCITLCWLCHYKNKRIGFEYQKQTVEEDGFDGQYTIWMREWLGVERFEALNARARTQMKQHKAIEQFQTLYQEG